ncbi:hypothetical protein BC828DRAFT_381754 [Blastocladiella britannica]|nr:hypothetical protein BC828DRAFT_381754 [Blastocladiella britannica]
MNNRKNRHSSLSCSQQRSQPNDCTAKTTQKKKTMTSETIPGPSSPVVRAVLTCPDLLWSIADFLDDADLRASSRVKVFAALLATPRFRRSRRIRRTRRAIRMLTVRNTSVAVLEPSEVDNAPVMAAASAVTLSSLSRVTRPPLSALVSANVMRGGVVTLRAHTEGHYVHGPEHAARIAVATRLARFFVRRMLMGALNARPPVADLAARAVIPVSSEVAIRSGSRTVAAPLSALARAMARDVVARALRHRPSLPDLVAAGKVPVHAIAAPYAYAPGPLLQGQVALANRMRDDRIARHLARRPYVDPEILERVLSASSISNVYSGDTAKDGGEQLFDEAAVAAEAGDADSNHAGDHIDDLLNMHDLSAWPLNVLLPSLVDVARVGREVDAFLAVRAAPEELAARKLLADRDFARLVCFGIRDKVRYFESLAATAIGA